MSNSHVDSGNISFTATDSPTRNNIKNFINKKFTLSVSMFLPDNSSNLPDTISFANQRPAAITLARIFSFFTSSANKSWIQIVVITKTCLSQLILAGVLIDNWNINFLQDVLVLSVFPVVFSPSCRPTSLT